MICVRAPLSKGFWIFLPCYILLSRPVRVWKRPWLNNSKLESIYRAPVLKQLSYKCQLFGIHLIIAGLCWWVCVPVLVYWWVCLLPWNPQKDYRYCHNRACKEKKKGFSFLDWFFALFIQRPGDIVVIVKSVCSELIAGIRAVCGW